jgi:hypothetical protein
MELILAAYYSTAEEFITQLGEYVEASMILAALLS